MRACVGLFAPLTSGTNVQRNELAASAELPMLARLACTPLMPVASSTVTCSDLHGLGLPSASVTRMDRELARRLNVCIAAWWGWMLVVSKMRTPYRAIYMQQPFVAVNKQTRNQAKT